jgi:hypothetical protein
MMAFLVAVRDVLFALALSWVGLSVERSVRENAPEQKPPASSDSACATCSDNQG